MKSKLLATAAGQRTFAVIFDTGDEVMAGLQSFAREQRLAGSHFTAIGNCREVILGHFEWEAKRYRPIPVDEQVEVLSLVGDVSLPPRPLRRHSAYTGMPVSTIAYPTPAVAGARYARSITSSAASAM